MLLIAFLACIETIPNYPANYFADRTDSDYDGDGFSEEEGDCDDENILRYPGKAEVCDGIDNDCDPEGLIDNDAIDAVRFFRDADDDGFGVENDFIDSCDSAVPGYVPEEENTLFDCLDTDPAVFPGNARNEANPNGCYLDSDNDNYGDATATEVYDLGTDCDDSDPNTFTGSAAFEDSGLCVLDADGDGYGDINVQAPFDVGQDCNDSDSMAHPNSIEICDDIDNNCDGVIDEDGAIGAPTWYADIDEDGFGNPAYSIQRCAIEAPEGYASNGLDCDDYLAEVYPGSDEVCNLMDDDCDGQTDEGVELTFYVDDDGDGFGVSTLSTLACTVPSGYADNDDDCDDADTAQNPDAEESCYNYEDDDCDGYVDEDDAYNATPWYLDFDGDSYGDAAVSTLACLPPQGHVDNADDCDDANPSIKPLAPEYCNGYDDNCDGLIDDPSALDIETYYADADGDSYGNPFLALDSCPVQSPSGEIPPAGYSDRAEDCNDNDASISPSELELCDMVDQNCDGDPQLGAIDPITWYVDSDGDGYGNEQINFISCEAPYGFVEQVGDCNDFEATTYPDAPEYCNGKLDDCNLAEDTAFSPRAVEVDNDGDGFIECTYDPAIWIDINNIPTGGDDCDDTRAAVYPDAPTICDGRYNDCDDVLAYPGVIPEDEADEDDDGYVVCEYDASTWDGDSTVVGGSDCIDNDEFVHPYAAELEPDAYLCAQDADDDGYADCGLVPSCDVGLFLTTATSIDFAVIPSGIDPYNEFELSNSYLMSTTEITQDIFFEVMDFNPSGNNTCGGDCPVDNVGYSTAAEFTNQLSLLYGLPECYTCTGYASERYCSVNPDYTSANNSSIYECPGYRLPTRAEWRKGCAVGTTNDYWTLNGGGNYTVNFSYELDDGSDIRDYANFSGAPMPVASKIPNGYGLYDMHGGVAEISHDRGVAFAGAPQITGLNPSSDTGDAVMRHGSSYDQGMWLNSNGSNLSNCYYTSTAVDYNQDYNALDSGFRIVQTLFD